MTAGEPVPRFGYGATERDCTYVDDIVDGVMASLDYVEAHLDAYERSSTSERVAAYPSTR